MPALPTNEFWDDSFQKYFPKSWLGIESLQKFQAEINKIPWYDLYRHDIIVIVCLPIVVSILLILVPVGNYWQLLTYLSFYKLIALATEVSVVDTSLPYVIVNPLIKYLAIPLCAQLLYTLCLTLHVIWTSHNNSSTERSTIAFIGVSTMFFIFLCYLCAAICLSNSSAAMDTAVSDYQLLSEKDQTSDKNITTGNPRVTNDHQQPTSHTTQDININDPTLTENSDQSKNKQKRSKLIEVYDRQIIVYLLFLSFILTTLIGANYYACQYFTWQWIQHQGKGTLLIYIVFQVTNNCFKLISKFVARYIDCNEYKTEMDDIVSVELYSEFIFVSFYYIFYRNLFSHVLSVWVFIGAQFLHITQESLLYPLRMTHKYYQFSIRIQNKLLNIVIAV